MEYYCLLLEGYNNSTEIIEDGKCDWQEGILDEKINMAVLFQKKEAM